MVNIIDRRHKKNTSAGNRKKFIERYKSQIKSRVDELAKGKSIKSFGEKEKIDIKGTDEPTFRHRSNSGKRQIVVPGNDKLRKGDTIDKQSSGKSGGAGPGEDSLDDFSFVLTKKEFLDIYFQGMKLPNFIKKAVFGSKKTTLKRAGYTKVGIPARLNLKKTMENAIARRIATKKKTPYLDDIDLRYNYFKEEPVPLNKAVMICLMDVSGSMQEREKTIAKKFFLLLYLFLEKNYEAVTLHFVTYTDIAYEVSENEFFYGQRTGGTLISSALELCDKIITENYQIATNNIYLAHVSDGDNWDKDELAAQEALLHILPKLQYYVYVQVVGNFRYRPSEYYEFVSSIKSYSCGHALIEDLSGVYDGLRKLFEAGA